MPVGACPSLVQSTLGQGFRIPFSGHVQFPTFPLATVFSRRKFNSHYTEDKIR